MIKSKRVLVVDRRRMIREGLCTVVVAELGFVAVSAEGNSPAREPDADIVLLGPGERLPDHLSDAAVVPFTDGDPLCSVVAMCRSLAGRAEDPDPRGPVRPTAREIEVIRGIADGLAARQIATILGISEKSVDNHKQRIFAKLGVHSQAHAVAVSLHAGWLPPRARRGELAG